MTTRTCVRCHAPIKAFHNTVDGGAWEYHLKCSGLPLSAEERAPVPQWSDDGQGGTVATVLLGAVRYTLRADAYPFNPDEPDRQFAARLYSGENGRDPVMAERWTWHESVDEAERAAVRLLGAVPR